MTTNPDYIVTKDDISTCGLISYWRLSGDVDLTKLSDAWQAQGLDPKLLPKAPGDSVALGRAVHTLAGVRRRVTDEEYGITWLVRPTAWRSAWALVEESRFAGQRPEYKVLLTVEFKNGSPAFTREEQSPPAYEEAVAKIRASFDYQRGVIATEDVSSWLVKIAHKSQSVPLRDTGGIYFVPRAHTDSWNRTVAAIMKVSTHRIFRIPALKNSEAVDAITDAITQETEAMVAAIEVELQSGKLGDRALQTRRAECEGILAKVSAYDTLLGVQLKCRERVESLQATIAATALLEGGDEAA